MEDTDTVWRTAILSEDSVCGIAASLASGVSGAKVLVGMPARGVSENLMYYGLNLLDRVEHSYNSSRLTKVHKLGATGLEHQLCGPASELPLPRWGRIIEVRQCYNYREALLDTELYHFA